YKCRHVAPMRQPGLPRNRGEILLQITAIIRLVIVLREAFKNAVIGRLVAALERVEQDQPPTRLQHARALLEDRLTRRRRQFGDHKCARDRLDAVIRRRDGLGVGDEEAEARPPPEVAARMPDIGLRQIETEHWKAWPSLLD